MTPTIQAPHFVAGPRVVSGIATAYDLAPTETARSRRRRQGCGRGRVLHFGQGTRGAERSAHRSARQPPVHGCYRSGPLIMPVSVRVDVVRVAEGVPGVVRRAPPSSAVTTVGSGGASVIALRAAVRRDRSRVDGSKFGSASAPCRRYRTARRRAVVVTRPPAHEPEGLRRLDRSLQWSPRRCVSAWSLGTTSGEYWSLSPRRRRCCPRRRAYVELAVARSSRPRRRRRRGRATGASASSSVRQRDGLFAEAGTTTGSRAGNGRAKESVTFRSTASMPRTIPPCGPVVVSSPEIGINLPVRKIGVGEPPRAHQVAEQSRPVASTCVEDVTATLHGTGARASSRSGTARSGEVESSSCLRELMSSKRTTSPPPM
jgi:hypothetical protein